MSRFARMGVRVLFDPDAPYDRRKRGIDSHSVLTRLAEILRVDVAEIGGPVPGTTDPEHHRSWNSEVNLDLARAYAMRRQDAAAVNLLLAAERLSPQLVRCNLVTHEVLTGLLRREHRPSTPELRPLARRFRR